MAKFALKTIEFIKMSKERAKSFDIDVKFFAKLEGKKKSPWVWTEG